MASVWREWRATGGSNRGTQSRHLGHSFSIQRMEGGENKSRRGWLARMAGGAQRPGWGQTRKAAVGCRDGGERAWEAPLPREQMGSEGRRGGVRRNKSTPDGPGNCRRGKGGGTDTSRGGGPGSSRGRQNCWPPAALCSWLRNVPSLPGDFGAPAGPVSYRARQLPHRELWGCLP